jgi:hypothetical protein
MPWSAPSVALVLIGAGLMISTGAAASLSLEHRVVLVIAEALYFCAGYALRSGMIMRDLHKPETKT